MTIYILNYITIAFYWLLIKDKKKFVLISCLQMWLIMALRSTAMGYDIENYEIYYKSYSANSFHSMLTSTRLIRNQAVNWGLESGYVWLNWICAKCGLSFHSFLVVHAAICMIGLGKFLKRYSSEALFTLMIIISFGIWGSFFTVLRQALALVVLLQSIDSIKGRILWKFLLYIVVACLFHKAAVFFIPTYWLYIIPINRKNVFFVVVSAITWFLAVPRVYSFFSFLLGLLGRSEMYVIGDMQTNKMIICFVALLIVVFTFRKKKRIGETDDFRLSFWGLVLTIFVEIISLYNSTFSRAAIEVLFPFATVALSDVVTKQGLLSNRRILGIVYFFVLFVFYCFVTVDSSIVPYIPIWG